MWNSPATSLFTPRPAVFLDRDGTLMDEVDYCRRPEDVRAVPGAAELLADLRTRGWLVILITNQSGIGRGILSLAEYQAVHTEFLRQINHQIDAAYFCPDAPPTPSPRRKPEPGMILEAMQEFSVQRELSWMVGDKAADIVCGKRAGLRTALVRTGYGKSYDGPEPDFVGQDVIEVLKHLADLPRPPIASQP